MKNMCGGISEGLVLFFLILDDGLFFFCCCEVFIPAAPKSWSNRSEPRRNLTADTSGSEPLGWEKVSNGLVHR